jgi:hypothetical protein
MSFLGNNMPYYRERLIIDLFWGESPTEKRGPPKKELLFGQ